MDNDLFVTLLRMGCYAVAVLIFLVFVLLGFLFANWLFAV